MANLQGFNAAEVEPSAPRELLPAGDYAAILIETDIVKKESGAEQFEFCIQITEGPYQNRRVYSNQNYTQKNGQPNTIGRGIVSQICRCVGVMTPNDTTELHHKRLVAKVGVEKSDGYDPKNIVKGFKQCTQTNLPPQPAGQQQAAPAGGAGAWAQAVG